MSEYIIGPISQLLPMTNLPLKGPISDTQMEIIYDAGIHVREGIIVEIAPYDALTKRGKLPLKKLESKYVALPGFIDCHTHICFAGSRARDFSMRIAGKTYLEIAKEGGGIWDTVTSTREANVDELLAGLKYRANLLLSKGITTIEVKSGYGLNLDSELKMLRAIKRANEILKVDLLPTCLAAHIVPKEFKGDTNGYLQLIINELIPIIKTENLSNRIDAFVEDEAFTKDNIRPYLDAAQKMSMDITLHADQFSSGGSALGVAYDAVSVDHLEASGPEEIKMLGNSNTVSVVLPGASIGLGCEFAPARAILDAGGQVAIASDWNPGSAPMGDLLVQASILATFQKLSNAEVLAGMTSRAAKALNLRDRGVLNSEKNADIILFEVSDYREILYRQGGLVPNIVIKNGDMVK